MWGFFEWIRLCAVCWYSCCIHMYAYKCMHKYVYIYMYIDMCVCRYVYIHISIYTHTYIYILHESRRRPLHISHLNASRHVAHMNESCRTYDWVIMNEWCHTYEWVHECMFINVHSWTHHSPTPSPTPHIHIQTHLESTGPSPLSKEPSHIHTHKNSPMHTQHSPYLTLSMAIHTLNSLKNCGCTRLEYYAPTKEPLPHTQQCHASPNSLKNCIHTRLESAGFWNGTTPSIPSTPPTTYPNGSCEPFFPGIRHAQRVCVCVSESGQMRERGRGGERRKRREGVRVRERARDIRILHSLSIRVYSLSS